MLSASCIYGIQAVVYLAAAESEGYIPIHRIGTDLDISGPFLTKVLQELKQKGIAASRRGPKGGVALAQPASTISLKDIIIAIDGDALFTRCVMGLPGCGTAKPCPMHESWQHTRAHLTALFSGLTVDRVARGAQLPRIARRPMPSHPPDTPASLP